MATIHTYKQARINTTVMWIQSVDGGPEIYLDARQAMQLGEAIAKQQRGTRSAPTAQRSASTGQRSVATIAPVVQRSAPVTRETGTRQFVGKSSFVDEKWKSHAISVAKTKAERGYKQLLQRLEAEKKACNVTARGGAQVLGNSVTYTITATLE